MTVGQAFCHGPSVMGFESISHFVQMISCRFVLAIVRHSIFEFDGEVAKDAGPVWEG